MSQPADLMWLAQRTGQDWRDEYVLAAISWLTSLVPRAEWESRLSAVEAVFQHAQVEWAAGRRVPLYDTTDIVAWYVHQAARYANPGLRPNFFQPEGYRIAPVFRRLGQLLPELRKVVGADERAARLMTDGRSQPDDAIYELLVAGTYRRRGWERVEFVPETPGVGRSPDLLVSREGTSWAVECKRAGRSGYARDERDAGERMASAVHAVTRAAGRSILVMVRFDEELTSLPEEHLVSRVARFLDDGEERLWEDEEGVVGVCSPPWAPLRAVLAHDDIYFGASRMIELAIGRFEPSLDYSVDGEWMPAEGRPLHATDVSRLSIVCWTSASVEAARRKARHFRSVVAKATGQLPGDRPGVVHVGYESIGGNTVDSLRHALNAEQMESFDAGHSGLQWVYGNYFTPEQVTARDESAAVSETTAHYRVRGASAQHPLPGHLLFMDEDGQSGAHFMR